MTAARLAACALLWLALAGHAPCQQPLPAAADGTPPAQTASPAPADATAARAPVQTDAQRTPPTDASEPAPSPQTGNTSTLDTIQVTAERPPVDLDKLRNRSENPDTVFSKDWKGPGGMEEFGMKGGVVPFAVNYALEKIRNGARKLPGWKRDQPATARPPPDLDEDQLRRAAQFEDATARPATP